MIVQARRSAFTPPLGPSRERAVGMRSVIFP